MHFKKYEFRKVSNFGKLRNKPRLKAIFLFIIYALTKVQGCPASDFACKKASKSTDFSFELILSVQNFCYLLYKAENISVP